MDDMTTMVLVATTPSNRIAGTKTTWGMRHQGMSAWREGDVRGVLLMRYLQKRAGKGPVLNVSAE